MEADYYQAQFEIEESHWWYCGRRRVLRSLLTTLRPQRRGRVLEIGCGGGGNLALLSGFGDELAAVEMEPSAVEMADSRGLAQVQTGKLGDSLPAFGRQHDVVALFDVLEHIPDDQDALRRIRPLLGNGGRLFITVPAYPWLWTRHDEVAHHYRRYTRAQLRSVLRASGYRVHYLGHFNTLLFPIALVTLLLARLLRLDPEGAIDQPARPLNALLRAVFGFEARLVPRWRLPFGLSIAAVAEPDNADS